jgi:uncharacterized membrane protein YesL
MSNLNIFNPEGKFIQNLSKVGHLIFVNIIYILTCLPLITIGASTVALYSTIKKSISMKEYFLEFKKNFKKATLIWLIILASFVLLAFDCHAFINGIQGVNLLVLICGGTLSFLGLILFVWAFPMMARFENSVGNYIKNSIVIAISKPMKTLLLLLINLLIPFVAVALQKFFFEFIIAILGIGFSGLAYICSEIINPVFDSYKQEIL